MGLLAFARKTIAGSTEIANQSSDRKTKQPRLANKYYSSCWSASSSTAFTLPVCTETVSSFFPRKLSPRSLNTVASSKMRSSAHRSVESSLKSSRQRAGLVAGENHVKTAFLVVATVDQVKEQPRIQAGSDTVLRFYLRQTVSKDGGAEVLCSPAGLITESDCGPVRRKVLATGVPSRAVTIPASELQAYLNSLPRLLTEHHDITLSGTNSDIVYVKDFHGYGSLSFHANNLGDCVFTRALR